MPTPRSSLRPFSLKVLSSNGFQRRAVHRLIGAGNRKALRAEEEHQVRAAPLGELFGEVRVHGGEAHDGADRRLAHFVFHGTCCNTKHGAAPNPCVVTRESVERVEHRRVSAKFHLGSGARFFVACLRNDAAIAVDEKERGKLVICRQIPSNAGERTAAIVPRCLRDRVLAGRRA